MKNSDQQKIHNAIIAAFEDHNNEQPLPAFFNANGKKGWIANRTIQKLKKREQADAKEKNLRLLSANLNEVLRMYPDRNLEVWTNSFVESSKSYQLSGNIEFFFRSKKTTGPECVLYSLYEIECLAESNNKTVEEYLEGFVKVILLQ